jgi:hypothetical protein
MSTVAVGDGGGVKVTLGTSVGKSKVGVAAGGVALGDGRGGGELARQEASSSGSRIAACLTRLRVDRDQEVNRVR